MDAETHAARRLSFGPAADLYDRIRPSYPPAAALWMFGEPVVDGRRKRIADLGAGTGIFTRVLVDLGYEVIPVEPDAGMRDKLVASTPGITPLAGSAEEIPLEDGCVDGACAAQAYHWFDPARAHPEIARVLRPGGIWGPIMNLRDESVDWVKKLSEVGGMEDGRDSRSSVFQEDEDYSFGELFSKAEIEEFAHEVEHDAETLMMLIQSRSYWITASPETKERMEGQVRTITDTLPETFALPYTTIAYRCHKL